MKLGSGSEGEIVNPEVNKEDVEPLPELEVQHSPGEESGTGPETDMVVIKDSDENPIIENNDIISDSSSQEVTKSDNR